MAGIAVSPLFSAGLKNQRLSQLCLRQDLPTRIVPCYISISRTTNLAVPICAANPAGAWHQNLCPLPQSPCLAATSQVLTSPALNLIQTLAQTLLVTFENACRGLAWCREVQPGEAETISALQNGVLQAAAPLCFAAISRSASVNTPLTVVASGMAKWLELYSGVLMVRVLLSWFPNIPWERQPLQAMRDMCDPYLNLFRNIIPPVFNALDLSPLLAFLVLGLLTSVLNTTIQA